LAWAASACRPCSARWLPAPARWSPATCCRKRSIWRCALGATRGFRADDPDVVAQLRAAIPGGVDIAIEAASSVPALDLAWKLTRRGGTTVTCSLPNPAHHLQLPVVQMTAEERTLKGSYLGSAVPGRDIPRFIELYRAGRLPVDRLITHRLRLAEINQGFDRLAAGQAVRQVIVF
jgi:alcohol dehydrogenase